MKLIYIAGKFTAKTAYEIEANIQAAEFLAREVIERTERFALLVPHSLGRRFMAGPGSPAYWYDATLEMSERCDAILLVPGWETSMGTHRERARALSAGKPVFETVEDLLAWHP